MRAYSAFVTLEDGPDAAGPSGLDGILDDRHELVPPLAFLCFLCDTRFRSGVTGDVVPIPRQGE